MSDSSVNFGSVESVSRRSILRLAAAAALGSWLGVQRSAGDTPPAHTNDAPSAAAGDAPAAQTDEPPWWLTAEAPQSRVVDVRATLARGRPLPGLGGMRHLIEEGLVRLTTTTRPGDAWKKVLGGAGTIALKFNAVGATQLETTPIVAEALVRSLRDAGYAPAQVMLIEAPEFLQRELRTRAPERGWGAPLVIEGELEDIAAWVYAADAIINVPFLKTHRLAGMSGALKNLSHAVIRRPARYHGNRCAPYVGRIVRHPTIAGRLRLTIVNALRTIFRNGPEAAREDIAEHAGLFLGFDPVALDAIGRELLIKQRKQAGESPDLSTPYLSAAVNDGVGRAAPHLLNLISFEVPV